VNGRWLFNLGSTYRTFSDLVRYIGEIHITSRCIFSLVVSSSLILAHETTFKRQCTWILSVESSQIFLRSANRRCSCLSSVVKHPITLQTISAKWTRGLSAQGFEFRSDLCLFLGNRPLCSAPSDDLVVCVIELRPILEAPGRDKLVSRSSHSRFSPARVLAALSYSRFRFIGLYMQFEWHFASDGTKGAQLHAPVRLSWMKLSRTKATGMAGICGVHHLWSLMAFNWPDGRSNTCMRPWIIQLQSEARS
jgi:hypothetical protein